MTERADESDADRGRSAGAPTEVPLRGWRDVLARTRAEAKQDHVSLLAAGVAFYALLALVPGLVAVITIYGLVAEPATIQEQVVDALGAAPAEVRDLVQTQLESISATSTGSAVFAVLAGLVLALWSASSGMQHVVEAINLAYDEEETRGFIRLRLLSLAFTVGAILFLIVAFGIIALLPALLAESGLGTAGRVLVGVLRWALLLAGGLAGLSVLYRYAPDRDEPRWAWASPGAVVATVLWLVASIVFSIYTANFGNYNETYGSLGAVVVLMLWLFLTALAVILGAELNSETERQTRRDTTEGREAPLGRRDAYAADTVGETAEQVKANRR